MQSRRLQAGGGVRAVCGPGAQLDIFWLKDESMEDAENLPPSNVLAAEIVYQLEVALEEFRGIEEALGVE